MVVVQARVLMSLMLLLGERSVVRKLLASRYVSRRLVEIEVSGMTM